MSTLAITGASGFLGAAIVAAARDAGHDVTAIVRRAEAAPATWADDPGINLITLDLTNAQSDLAKHLSSADAVIHAAAGSGSDANHAQDTLEPTKNLVRALSADTRLVLVSSFSVYAFGALPDWATLDETSPTDPDLARRDAYARAKAAQEAVAIHSAQHRGLSLWIARPGAIYGPARLITARLGWQKAGRWLVPGGHVPIPAIHVDHCARALVAAATAKDAGWPNDLPILAGSGAIRIVNLVAPDPPSQSDWRAAASLGGGIKLPLGLLMKLGKALDLIGDISPKIGRHIPNSLREPTLAARFKPLRYATARADDRLGLAAAPSFEASMTSSRDATK